MIDLQGILKCLYYFDKALLTKPVSVYPFLFYFFGAERTNGKNVAGEEKEEKSDRQTHRRISLVHSATIVEIFRKAFPCTNGKPFIHLIRQVHCRCSPKKTIHFFFRFEDEQF